MKDEQNRSKSAADKIDAQRRDILKISATAMLATPLLNAETAISAATRQSYSPRFFTRAEFALVDELSEIIIPTDNHSPGARAAKVAEYIDFQLAEAFTEEPQKQWRDGLKLIDVLAEEMHGKVFMQCSPQERIAVVTRIAANESSPQNPAEKFFVELKQRTAHAYYTSEIGIKTELEYKGNTYLNEFSGSNAK